ncbi:MAG: hypothetical protein FWE53_03260 [Firmicutes bacterium]|nr:hypothetical protein [Bacillota bacterium]
MKHIRYWFKNLKQVVLAPLLCIAIAAAPVLHTLIFNLTARADMPAVTKTQAAVPAAPDYTGLTNINTLFNAAILGPSATDWQVVLDSDAQDAYQINDFIGMAYFTIAVTVHGVDFDGITIYLTEDIDHSDYSGSFRAIGTAANPFTGTFDGNGKTIILNNFNTNISQNPIIGLFGVISNAVIRNLTVTGEVAGWPNQYVGAIASQIENSVIINCFNKAVLTGTAGYVGNIAGLADSGSVIENCISLDDIDGWEDWETEGRLEFVRQLNRNVLDLLAGGDYEGLLFWGMDDEGYPAIGAEPIFDDWYAYTAYLLDFAIGLADYAYYGDPDDLEGFEGLLEIFESNGADAGELSDLESIYLQAMFDFDQLDIHEYYDDLEGFFDEVFGIITAMLESYDELYYEFFEYDSDDREYEEMLKEFALEMIAFSYEDNRSFMEGACVENYLALDKAYLEDLILLFTIRLTDYTIKAFTGEILKAISSSIHGFDAIYYEWADVFELDQAMNYEVRLKTFAADMINFSYKDNIEFMDRENSVTDLYKSYIQEIYDLIMDETGSLTFGSLSQFARDIINNVTEGAAVELNLATLTMLIDIGHDEYEIKSYIDFFDEIEAVINAAIWGFDEIYYAWEAAMEMVDIEDFRQGQINELLVAYNAKLNLISDEAIREQLEAVYNEALEVLEETDFVSWGNFTYTLGVAVANAKAEFNKIQADWEGRKLVVTLMTVGGIITSLLLVGSLIILILYIKKRRQSFLAYACVDEDNSQTAQLAHERGELMAKIIRLEREQKEMAAEVQKEKIASAKAKEEREAIIGRAISKEVTRVKTEMAAFYQKEIDAAVAEVQKEKEQTLQEARKIKDDAVTLVLKAKEKIVEQDVKEVATERKTKEADTTNPQMQDVLRQIAELIEKNKKGK